MRRWWDVRLKNGVKDQLDATRDGLSRVFGTRSDVWTIKHEIDTVDRMGSDSRSAAFHQFDLVSI